MTRLAFRLVTVASFAIGIGVAVLHAPSAEAASSCVIYGSGGQRGVLVQGSCTAAGSTGAVLAETRRTKVIVCGAPSSADNGLWDPRCGTPRRCPTGEAFATLTLVNGVWTHPIVWCPSTGTPAQIADAIRAQAIRLLPHVRIGIAPPDAVTLVNIETVLWADTAADRALPAATVLGRRVELRIHLVGADWSYGDGTHDSSTGPRKAYDDARNPCRSAQCPDYAGHTYLRTGHDTITLTTRWHAEYSLDAGANWHDIAGTLTAPLSSQSVTVKQARAVLVPNPGDH